MSKRNPRIIRGRLISAQDLMKYDIAIMSAVIDDALEEQNEITRGYRQVVERMNHLMDSLDDAFSFTNVGSSSGFAGFEDIALSLY